MLCHTCQRRQTCLPLLLAQTDAILLQQLSTLQQCDGRRPVGDHCQLQRSTHPHNKLMQWFVAVYRHLRNLLLFLYRFGLP
ncbi:MAG: hypothetical protein HC851_15045 [Acaryochloris sp. RU_4_1]|nr:hypothetical protein [Acaryochloris sp. RU_4_1]NJR53689.1 hypothetical protein [Acaryochloris sp. CRU_2_0]